MIKKILVRMIAPTLVSLACFYLVVRNVRWGEVGDIFSKAKGLPILLGLAISLITLLIRAHRWQILLLPFQKIANFTLLRWQIGGLLINNLLPLRMGEFARAYWAGHKSSISKSAILATIFLERFFDVSSLAVIGIFLLFVLGLHKENPFFEPENMAVIFFTGGTLILLGFWISKRTDKKLLWEKLKRRVPSRLAEISGNFFSGLKIIQDKSELARLIFFSLLIWNVDIVVIATISRSLEMNLTLAQGGLLMIGLILGVMIPAAPGALGTYEAGGVAALTLMGFDKTRSFSFVLLLRIFQYMFVTVLGIPVLIAEGFNPKKLFDNDRGN